MKISNDSLTSKKARTSETISEVVTLDLMIWKIWVEKKPDQSTDMESIFKVTVLFKNFFVT